jgi:hypothetical protein
LKNVNQTQKEEGYEHISSTKLEKRKIKKKIKKWGKEKEI